MASNLTNSQFKPLLPADKSEFTVQIVIHVVGNIIGIFSAILLCLMTSKSVLSISKLFNWLLWSLSISDMAVSVSELFRDVAMVKDMTSMASCSPSLMCVITSACVTFTTLSSLVWTIAIGICCTLTLVRPIDNSHQSRRTGKAIINIICWGCPVTVTLAALIRGAFGKTDTVLTTTCWIRTCEAQLSCAEQFAWMLMTSKFWETLCYLTIVNLIFVGICLRRRPNTRDNFSWAVTDSSSQDARSTTNLVVNSETNETRLQSEIKRIKLFLWIPVCFLLCRIWGTVRFSFDVYFMFHPTLTMNIGIPDEIVLNLKVLLDQAQPICNCILVFIFCPESWLWIKESFCAKTCSHEDPIPTSESSSSESSVSPPPPPTTENSSIHSNDVSKYTNGTYNSIKSRFRTWSGSFVINHDILSGSSRAANPATGSSYRDSGICRSLTP